MTKFIKNDDTQQDNSSVSLQRHFHDQTAGVKDALDSVQKIAALPQDGKKFGNILKKVGGGLSRHRSSRH